MFQVKLSEGTAARRRIPILLVDATDGYTPETGITTPTIKVSKNGGTQATGTGTFTEIGTGQYYYEFASGEVDTLGWVTFNLQKAGCRDYNAIVQIMAYDAMDAVRLGLTALPNANAASAGGLLTSGTGSHQINTSAGVVDANAIQISGDATAADNLEAAADGTGYNLGGGSIVAASVSGAVNSVTTGVTVASNTDKTGYSLATAPPTAAAIADAVWDEALSGHLTSGSTGAALNAAGSSGDPWATSLPGAYGAGTAGKIIGDNINATISSRSTLDASAVRSAVGLASANLDTQLDALPTAAENADAVWDEAMSGHTTAGTYGGRIPRSDSSNVEVKITGSAHIAADVHEFQPDVIDAAAIAANAIDASALATDAVTEIAQGVLSEATSTNTGVYAAGDVGNILGRLHNMIEADGADFRYTTNALEQAPSGGGGGTTFATGNVPYQVRADEQFPGGVIDILVGTLLRLDLQVLDRDGNAINLTGATVTVGVRNASTGATVGSDQSASLSLARLGYITVDTVAAWSATAGTYRLTVSATVGSDVIVAGPLQLIVRAR